MTVHDVRISLLKLSKVEPFVLEGVYFSIIRNGVAVCGSEVLPPLNGGEGFKNSSSV